MNKYIPNITEQINKDTDFIVYATAYIQKLIQNGQKKSADSYTSTLHKFESYFRDEIITLEKIDSKIINKIKEQLENENLSPNTVGYYLRSIRAIYNQSTKDGIIQNKYPFENIIINESIIKRNALNKETLKKIEKFDLLQKPRLSFARDMFMFSYYAHGIAYCDMALLTNKNIKGKILEYRKRGDGTLLKIQIKPEMQKIIDKYTHYPNQKGYLLPILCETARGSNTYDSAMRVQNRRLDAISKLLKLPNSISSATAKHTWAALALKKGLTIDKLGYYLGISNDTTTKKYIQSLRIEF